MPWWLWILLGFVLLAMEMLSTGLNIAFFGFGAMVVGALVGFGIGGPLWLQILLFSAISLVSLALLRKPLRRGFGLDRPAVEIDTLVGESAEVTAPIDALGRGKAELRGTTWAAQNVSDAPLERGDRCIVERVEGLTLYIRPART
jgi:inner membrane protein